MKILISSQHFYPDNFRINDITKELVARGHEVTVITSLPDYATGTVPADCKGLKNRRIDWNGVKVIRTFSVSRRTGLIFRILNYISFFLSSTIMALTLKEKFDVTMCYQTSPILMASAASTYAKKHNVPFFNYCMDPWPEALKAWHVGEGNPLFKVMHKYSKSIYNGATLVGASSKPFMEYLHTVDDVPMDKLVYLPQHAESLDLKEKVKGENTVFAFGGNIGSVQNIECIIRAVAEIRDVTGYSVEIYGDGSELQNCKKLSTELGADEKITFFGRVTWDELKEKYNNADAFLLTLKPEGIIGQTVPAKLQEYMSGGRTVIASIDGAAKEIIEESRCGICVPADDHKALADAMKYFVENREKFGICEQNGKKYFNENFTREKFITDLENHFESMLK
jgi:glycosyltransferase involved in cell wall biosynthesis